MAAHPQFKHATIFVSFAFLFSLGFVTQFAKRTCEASGFGVECFIGWTSVLSCALLFVLLAMLALCAGEPIENIQRFKKNKVGKLLYTALIILVPAQIAWHLWRLTIDRYETGDHGALMLLYGYFALVSSLLTLVCLGVLCYRFISSRQQERSGPSATPQRVRCASQPADSPGAYVVRYVRDREYTLRYDGLDEMGFGQATDPETGEQFLLNKDTSVVGERHWKLFPIGQRFRAKVTKTQYVVSIRALLRD